MRLLRYFVIRLTTRKALTAANIYQMIYHSNVNNEAQQPTDKSKDKPKTSVGNSEKRQELIESLNYIKSKEFKTKKDKESISVIESILANM